MNAKTMCKAMQPRMAFLRTVSLFRPRSPWLSFKGLLLDRMLTRDSAASLQEKARTPLPVRTRPSWAVLGCFLLLFSPLELRAEDDVPGQSELHSVDYRQLSDRQVGVLFNRWFELDSGTRLALLQIWRERNMQNLAIDRRPNSYGYRRIISGKGPRRLNLTPAVPERGTRHSAYGTGFEGRFHSWERNGLSPSANTPPLIFLQSPVQTRQRD